MSRPTVFVALLRAVNVGGTGKLPMSELKRMCERAGFRAVRTYIASGNVVFASEQSERMVKTTLEKKLRAYTDKPVGVLLRTAKAMEQVLARNPFPDAPASRTVAIFLDDPPARDALRNIVGKTDEELGLGKREIYVYYPGGMGASKLKIPAARAGTARNMNTLATLAAMAKEIEGK
jgi:uncharacterized protein (DUF1697 family)